MRKSRYLARASLSAVAATALLAGCGADPTAATRAVGNTVTMWTHNAGSPDELGIVRQMVDDFNASQDRYRVKIQSFPQGSYNDAVVGAAAAEKLPCLLDIDGPNTASYAWGDLLAPLDLSSGDVPISAQLPSTVGKYRGKVYSYGYMEAAMTLYARKSVLAEHDIRVPTLDRPWTKAEFSGALAKLKASGTYAYPLDMGTAGVDEFWTYAFSPQLQSFGGDLIDRKNYKSADGVLNGPAAVRWATWFRSLATKGYVAQKSGKDSVADFVNGKSALFWGFNASAKDVVGKFGDDAVFLPPPDLGEGVKVGGASWQVGMSATCDNKAGAEAYLNFSRKTKYFAKFAEAANSVPVTDAAARQVDGFGKGERQHFFVEESRRFATLRPVTPAYPYLSSVFAKTARDILAGASPKPALDQAVEQIDNNLRMYGNYAD